MGGRWPWEGDSEAERAPQPNRQQRRAMQQQAKRNQRRGQRAFDRQQKAIDRAKTE